MKNAQVFLKKARFEAQTYIFGLISLFTLYITYFVNDSWWFNYVGSTLIVAFLLLNMAYRNHIPFAEIKEGTLLIYGGFFLKRRRVNLSNIDSIEEIIDLSKPSSNWKYLAHELLSSYYLKKNDSEME